MLAYSQHTLIVCWGQRPPSALFLGLRPSFREQAYTQPNKQTNFSYKYISMILLLSNLCCKVSVLNSCWPLVSIFLVCVETKDLQTGPSASLWCIAPLVNLGPSVLFLGLWPQGGDNHRNKQTHYS